MSTPEPSFTGTPKRGDIIAGKYRVEDVLGKGGMGVVVAAEHTLLRQRVAIKFLLPMAAEMPGAVERFLREARAASSIQSEHVTRVLDVGTLPDGVPYLVLELLTGRDLGATLKERGSLPVNEATDLILQACEALAEAHAQGIVHRDLKPANLFVAARADGSPLVKILDFGLAKALHGGESGERDQSLTATSAVIGSPQYMSPEQFRGVKNVDTRTDLWALGVILYAAVTGKRPFDGDTYPEICMSVVSEAPEPPSSHQPDVPKGFEAAVMGCLEKDKDRRVQTVAELARAIAPFGGASAAISLERIQKIAPAAVSKSGSISRSSAPGEGSGRSEPARNEPAPKPDHDTVSAVSGTQNQPARRSLSPSTVVFGLIGLGLGAALAISLLPKATPERAQAALLALPAKPAVLPSATVSPVSSPEPAQPAQPVPTIAPLSPSTGPAKPAQSAIRSAAAPSATASGAPATAKSGSPSEPPKAYNTGDLQF